MIAIFLRPLAKKTVSRAQAKGKDDDDGDRAQDDDETRSISSADLDDVASISSQELDGDYSIPKSTKFTKEEMDERRKANKKAIEEAKKGGGKAKKGHDTVTPGQQKEQQEHAVGSDEELDDEDGNGDGNQGEEGDELLVLCDPLVANCDDSIADAGTCMCLFEEIGSKGVFTAVVGTATGTVLVLGESKQRTKKEWDTRPGRFTKSFEPRGGAVVKNGANASARPAVTCIACSDRFVVCGDRDGSVHVFAWKRDGSSSARGLEARATLASAHKGAVRDVAVDGSGLRFVTGGDDCLGLIVDASRSSIVDKLVSHQAAIGVVACCKSNIATGSDDGSIYLWSWEKGLVVAKLAGHKGPVSGITFVPHLSLARPRKNSAVQNVIAHEALVSCGHDETLRTWEGGIETAKVEGMGKAK